MLGRAFLYTLLHQVLLFEPSHEPLFVSDEFIYPTVASESFCPTINEQVVLPLATASFNSYPPACIRTKCSFIVGQKDSLTTAGYMNLSNTNNGSWNGCARRTWCNSVYKNALPSTLLPIFKQFKTITAQTYNGSTNQESVDYFALPAAKEMFGGSASSAGSSTGYSNLTEFNALFQFDYYKTTSSNRVKKRGKTGTASTWWGRSPYCSYSTDFCGVYSDGNVNYDNASYAFGLAPFGCI